MSIDEKALEAFKCAYDDEGQHTPGVIAGLKAYEAAKASEQLVECVENSCGLWCPNCQAHLRGPMKRELVAVNDIDVEIAIAEAIMEMPPRTTYEDKGTPVLEYLKKHGWFVMQEKSNVMRDEMPFSVPDPNRVQPVR